MFKLKLCHLLTILSDKQGFISDKTEESAMSIIEKVRKELESGISYGSIKKVDRLLAPISDGGKWNIVFDYRPYILRFKPEIDCIYLAVFGENGGGCSVVVYPDGLIVDHWPNTSNRDVTIEIEQQLAALFLS